MTTFIPIAVCPGGEIEEHQSVCGFEPVACTNQCGLRVTRNRIQAHLSTVCTKRQVAGYRPTSAQYAPRDR
jgi:hypothetical protein